MTLRVGQVWDDDDGVLTYTAEITAIEGDVISFIETDLEGEAGPEKLTESRFRDEYTQLVSNPPESAPVTESLGDAVVEFLFDRAQDSRELSTSLTLRAVASSIEMTPEPLRTFSALQALLINAGRVDAFLKEIADSPTVREALGEIGCV